MATRVMPATGPLMVARARAAGVAVQIHTVGSATILVMPSSSLDIDNRAFDVDPRAPGEVADIVDVMKTSGREPLLELDSVLLDDVARTTLAALGLQRRWGVAELQRELSEDVQEVGADVVVREVRLDEADLFGQLAMDAFGEAPAGLPRADHDAIRDTWTAYRRVGLARCSFAEIEGVPCGVAISLRVGELTMVDGAATLPAYRGRGAQLAMLAHRFREAKESGSRLAFTRTGEGSPSQRNLLRAGMHLARSLEVWGLAPR